MDALNEYAAVSRVLPGGYKGRHESRKKGDTVFFLGPSQTFQSGDTVVHGRRGEVVGPATDKAVKGKGVAIKFPDNEVAIKFFSDNEGDVSCDLKDVRRPQTSHCTLHVTTLASTPSVLAGAVELQVSAAAAG